MIRKNFWLLLALFLLVCIPRLIRLDRSPQHADEYFDRTGGLLSITALLDGDFLNSPFWQDPLYYSHPPLARYFSGIMSVLAKAEHGSPKGILFSRLPSVLFAALSVAAVYIFVLSLTSGHKLASFAAAIFLAFDSIFMIMTRTAEHYCLAILFIILSMYFFHLAVKTKKTKYFLISALAVALGVASSLIVLIIPLVWLAWFAVEKLKAPDRRQYLFHLFVFTPAAIVIAFALLWPQFVFNWPRVKKLGVIVSHTYQGFDTRKTVNPFTIFSVDQPRGPKGKLWIEKVTVKAYPSDKVLATYLPKEILSLSKITLTDDDQSDSQKALLAQAPQDIGGGVAELSKTFPPGDYRFHFFLKTDDPQLNLRLAEISILAEGKLKEPVGLVRQEIMGSDFLKAAEYQEFILPVAIDQERSLGFGINFIGEGKLSLDLKPTIHWSRNGSPIYFMFLFFRTPLPELFSFFIGLIFLTFQILFKKKHRPEESLLLIWFLGEIILLQFILFTKRVQYFSIITPVLAVIGGLGLDRWLSTKDKCQAKWWAIAFVLIQISSVLAFYPLYNYRLMELSSWGGSLPDFLGGLP